MKDLPYREEESVGGQSLDRGTFLSPIGIVYCPLLDLLS